VPFQAIKNRKWCNNNMEVSDVEDEWIDVNPNGPLEVPEWGCGDTFKPGRRFLEMTYAELYAKVQELHVSNGGVHLDVQTRPFKKGRKPLKNPEAPRSDRNHEERRVYFNRNCPCNFHFFVRRVAECAVPGLEGVSMRHHKEYMKCETKCDWYIDGQADQIKEGRTRTVADLIHRGHHRNILSIGKVTTEILEFITDLAKHHVTVASIASAVLEKFHCVVPDSALYYALRGLGYAIDSLGNQVLVKKNFKSHAQGLLHSLQSTKDLSYAFLVEDFEKSTTTSIAYETWVRGFDGDKETLLPSDMCPSVHAARRLKDLNSLVVGHLLHAHASRF
jgi:hypothetical protein